MPPKIRELKAALRKAGFSSRSAKGSHTVWRHPLLPHIRVTLSSNDGDDAGRFHEDEVEAALAALRDLERRLKTP